MSDLSRHPDVDALRTAATPAFLFARDGSLRWANAAAAAFCGAADSESLTRRSWPSRLRAQIETVAKTLAPGARRLERMPITPLGRTTPLTAQVRCLEGAAGERLVLVLASESVPAAKLAAALAALPPAQPEPSPPEPRAEIRTPLEPPAPRSLAAEPQAIDVEAEPRPSSSAEPAPDLCAAVAEPAEGEAAPSPRTVALAARAERPLRFVWHADEAGRLSYVSPDFVAALGAEAMPSDDETLAEFAARAGLDDGALVVALSSHVTWSGLRVAWPIAGTAERAEVELSAMPASNLAGFAGYRGFGVVLGLAAASAEASAAPRAADDPPSASPPSAGDDAAETPAPPSDETSSETAASPSDAPAGSPPAEADTGATVLPFPRPGAVGERRLAATDEAALRTIARVLGGPIGLAAAAQPAAEAAVEPGIQPEPEPPPPDTVPAEGALPSAFFAQPGCDAASPVPEPSGLREALAEARAEAAEAADILDVATDGVVVLSKGGQVLSLNRSAEALFGIDAAAVRGEPLARLLAPESHRAAADYLEGLAGAGVASVLNDGREVVGLERNGGRIPLFMTLGRLSRPGAEDRFCAVLRDITHWKKAERDLTEAKRQAEAASAQKSEFLAKISHEIRTPLNAIIGFSDVMLEERFGRLENDRYRAYVADIRASGEHLLALVNDLLDLSKIEAGKLELSFGAVRLADIVQQTVATMQPQANRDGVILRTSLPRVPLVVADARSLRQILFNLVSNGIKFTRTGGQVIVSIATTENGEVALRVRDTGVGMSSTEISVAMEPFRQVATRSRAEVDGTGLGLPLTKALAEANRAAFALESTPDQGTLATVTFPATRVLAE
jgi:PAS domain S-box-containing protein